MKGSDVYFHFLNLTGKRTVAMNSAFDQISYAMTLMATEASTGFFACLPNPEPDMESALDYLDQHPLDSFMHRYVLGLLGRMPQENIQALWDRADGRGTMRKALIMEAALSTPHLSSPGGQEGASEIAQLAKSSPLIALRARARTDHGIHQNWNHLLAANLSNHQLLPEPDQAPRPFPYPAEAVADPGGVYITQILSQWPGRRDPSAPRPSAEETAAMALEKLRALNLLDIHFPKVKISQAYFLDLRNYFPEIKKFPNIFLSEFIPI